MVVREEVAGLQLPMVDRAKRFMVALPGAPRERWAFYGLLLVAFAARVHGLTFHSLWLDEAVSVYLARFSLPEIFLQGMTLAEPNPPLYHLSLAVWMRGFGSSEAAVRLLSAFLGTLYVPVVYLLGRRLFSIRLAIAATLLAALNPFLVWYSQEARMFALVATLSLGALYAFARALDAVSLRWWLAYVGFTVASLYAHFYAAFLLPAELLCLFVYAARRRSVLLQGLLAWGVSLLSFLPWLLRAWQLSGITPSWRPTMSLGAMVGACLEAFTVRRTPLSGVSLGTVLVASGLLAIVGLGLSILRERRPGPRLWRRLGRQPALFVALTLVVPFLAAYALSFRQQIFAVYYLIIIVGPFLLALAAGIDRLASFTRVAGIVSLVLVVGGFLYGLHFDWSAEYRKEEWRAAARYVTAHAGSEDAVLCHVNYTRIPFSYYYQGLAPVFAPFGGPLAGEEEVAPLLEGLSDHRTVWLVQSHIDWGDPGRNVEGWLSARFPLVTEQYPPGVEVKAYATRYRLDEAPSTARVVDAVYDGEVRLVACEVDGEVFSASDDTYHPPSGWIHVTLYWQPLMPIPDDCVATVRLIDAAHQVWGGALERPTGTMRFYPTSAWQAGEVVRDDYDVNLNRQTPDGTYDLQVSLLSSAGEPMLPSFGAVQGEGVIIGQVRISNG
jgi:mannosyltransferase